MFNYIPIKHKQMSFVSNGGKFKLYTVLNGLIFPTPTQPRISFERPIHILDILAGAPIEERLGSNRYIVNSNNSCTADGGRCVIRQEPSGEEAVASGDATDYRSGVWSDIKCPIHSLKHKPNLTNELQSREN
jgi:hypothetical protein